MHYLVNTRLGFAFDEDWYLSQNEDVAQSVHCGGWRSGLQHFLAHGLAEGRRATPANGVARPLSPAAPVGPALDAAPIAATGAEQHNGPLYLVPAALSRTPLAVRRAAFIGSCFLREWGFEENNPGGCQIDFFLVNHAAELPARSRDQILQYDFQVIQVPLRSIVDDAMLWRLSYHDVAGHEAAFETACLRLEVQLDLWLKYNIEHSLLTFVTNFFQSQDSAIGRLLPRYDLRNPGYFISRLNERLEQLVRQHKNAYILDTDRIAASLGRRYTQDDAIAITAHGGLFPLTMPVHDRIESLAAMSSYYDIRWHREFPHAVWAELAALLRTVRQLDAVKLVVVDLDDTLWAGVSGEMTEVSPFIVEGWPLGLIEALLYLKKRGILLAIVSKNDEVRIRRIWDEIFFGRLKLDDFVALRINWKPKQENMQEILDAINILPSSVVFIDDNPTERAAMQHAFPDMRILGQDPYYLRRILLWAPEAQVAAISDESGRRTEMVQAQITRETVRKGASRAEFLAAAAPKVRLTSITSTDHPRFGRVIELLNKTNQFNTTGRRWKLEECDELLRGGGAIWAFDVTDAFTNYGLVGAVVVRGRVIEQWVMSCRVLGYQIEEAVMAHIVRSLTIGTGDDVTGLLIETVANLPSRDLFARCGFAKDGDRWSLAGSTVVQAPPHVTLLSM